MKLEKEGSTPQTSITEGNRQRWLLPFLGLACAVGVASIYLNQPLLAVMGRSLHATARQMMFVATATQAGSTLR